MLSGIPAPVFLPQVEEKEGRGGTGATALFFLISANFQWTRSKNVLHACMHMCLDMFQLSQPKWSLRLLDTKHEMNVWNYAYFMCFFLAGGVAIASATDQQETCPMDINELPVPAEVHMTTSPETSSDSKREVYQRLRKKTPPEDARVPAPQALPSQEKPSTSDKPESTEELEEAGEGLASSGQ